MTRAKCLGTHPAGVCPLLGVLKSAAHTCSALSVLFKMEFVANFENWKIFLKNSYFQQALKTWNICPCRGHAAGVGPAGVFLSADPSPVQPSFFTNGSLLGPWR